MGGLFDAVFGALDRRLFSTVLLPVVLFVAALGAVIVSGVGWARSVRWWTGQAADVRLLLGFGALALALLLAQVFTARLDYLVMRYQGYWNDLPGGRLLADRLTRRHRAFYAWLSEEDPRWGTYPADESQLMPTTFGNILRGASEHSSDRYALDSSTAWPRLYPLLPEAFRQAFALAAAELELAVLGSALGGLFALVGGLLAALILPWYAAVLCFSAGLLLAWQAYRAAVRAAEPYAQLYRSAFDVHRMLLLDAMGLTRPTGIAEELRQWIALDQLWMRGAVSTDRAPDLGYPRPSRPLPSASSASSDEVTAGAPAAGPPAPGGDLGDPDEAPPSVASRPVPPAPVRWSRNNPVVLGILGVLFVVGLVFVVRSAGAEQVPVAARDLPAYRPIAAGDLSGRGVRRWEGRYPLRTMLKGRRVGTGGLGPALPAGALAGRRALALAPPKIAPSPALARGASVTIRVVPSGSGQRAFDVSGALVLDLLPGGGVVVAVPGGEAVRLSDALAAGTGQLIIDLS